MATLSGAMILGTCPDSALPKQLRMTAESSYSRRWKEICISPPVYGCLTGWPRWRSSLPHHLWACMRPTRGSKRNHILQHLAAASPSCGRRANCPPLRARVFSSTVTRIDVIGAVNAPTPIMVQVVDISLSDPRGGFTSFQPQKKTNPRRRAITASPKKKYSSPLLRTRQFLPGYPLS